MSLPSELKVSFDFDKRLSELNDALTAFAEHHLNTSNITLEVAEGSIEIITLFYGRWLYKSVKPLLPKKVNRYKMAALTALTIVKVQPIKAEDEYEQRKINGEFAFFTIISLILSMPEAKKSVYLPVDSFDKDTGITRVEKVFSFSRNQILSWLIAKNKNSMPVFAFGGQLFILFELYKHRFQSLMI